MASQIEFPPVEFALDEPNGLLATGGNLNPDTLLQAYSKGIFPWYSDGQPIMWWSPDPRTVIFPLQFRPSRSLKKTLQRCGWSISINQCFEQVIRACSTQRRSGGGGDDAETWITDEMLAAYCELHRLGHAHSVEVWQQDELIGGLYGIACGRVFSGESMFHRVTDASKVAFTALCHHAINHGISLIDCQVSSPHLTSLGAVEIERATYIEYLPAANRDTIITETTSCSSHAAAWSSKTLAHAADYIRVFDEYDQ